MIHAYISRLYSSKGQAGAPSVLFLSSIKLGKNYTVKNIVGEKTFGRKCEQEFKY